MARKSHPRKANRGRRRRAPHSVKESRPKIHHKHHDTHPQHKASGHATQKSQIEENVEHFGKEAGAIGESITKHFEERHMRHQGWWHKTFGIAGPFISSTFGIVIFFLAITAMNYVNGPVGNVFMFQLSRFLFDNAAIFFLIFVLFSYSSYFSRYAPHFYRPISPLVVQRA